MNTSRIRVVKLSRTAGGLLLLWTLQMALPGALGTQTTGIKFLGPLSRVITPNGDGLNDRLVLCVDNPKDSGVSGAVLDLHGAHVASLDLLDQHAGDPPGPAVCKTASGQRVGWNGRSEFGTASSAVYVYVVEAEGQRFTGAFVVVR